MDENNTNAKNLKDFLQLYNQMTENCFYQCVNEMNNRHLNSDEETCVNFCSVKFINTNQKLMSLYVNVQSSLNKRLQESETGTEL